MKNFICSCFLLLLSSSSLPSLLFLPPSQWVPFQLVLSPSISLPPVLTSPPQPHPPSSTDTQHLHFPHQNLLPPSISTPSALAPIPSNLGYQDLAMASPSLSPPVRPALTPITIFDASDDSILSCPSNSSTCSVLRLLKEHVVPGLFSHLHLSKLSLDTKLETFFPNRCFIVTSSVRSDGRSNTTVKIFIDGIQNTHLDLSNDGKLILHSIRGFISYLAPISFHRFPPSLVSSAHIIAIMIESYSGDNHFNNHLIKTKISDEIDPYTTVIVLALPGSVVSFLAAKFVGIKNVIHLVLRDCHDPTKLSDLPSSITLSTTLCQTIDNTLGNSVFINITTLYGGLLDVPFSTTAPNVEASKAKEDPYLSALYNLELVALVQYHITASYIGNALLKKPNKHNSIVPAMLWIRRKHDLSIQNEVSPGILIISRYLIAEVNKTAEVPKKMTRKSFKLHFTFCFAFINGINGRYSKENFKEACLKLHAITYNYLITCNCENEMFAEMMFWFSFGASQVKLAVIRYGIVILKMIEWVIMVNEDINDISVLSSMRDMLVTYNTTIICPYRTPLVMSSLSSPNSSIDTSLPAANNYSQVFVNLHTSTITVLYLLMPTSYDNFSFNTSHLKFDDSNHEMVKSLSASYITFVIGIPDVFISSIINLKTTISWLSTNSTLFFFKTKIVTIDNKFLIDTSIFIIPPSGTVAAVRSFLHSSLSAINHFLVHFLFDKPNFAPHKFISISHYTFTHSSLIAQLNDNRHQLTHFHLQNANADILSSPHVALIFTSKTSFDNTSFNFTRNKYKLFFVIGSISDLEDKVVFERAAMIRLYDAGYAILTSHQGTTHLKHVDKSSSWYMDWVGKQ